MHYRVGECFDVVGIIEYPAVSVVGELLDGAVEFCGDDRFCKGEGLKYESGAWVIVCGQYGCGCETEDIVGIGQWAEEGDAVFYAEPCGKAFVLQRLVRAGDSEVKRY